jgi:hypothetical protein
MRRSNEPTPIPQPVTVAFGTRDDLRAWYRLLFALYLKERGLIGKGDMEAAR